MAMYAFVYYTHLYTQTFCFVNIALADDDKDLFLPLVFILKTWLHCEVFSRMHCTWLWRNKRQKYSCSENSCEKLKLWVWCNSNGTAEYFNLINCFRRTLKCCDFDILKHKCKEQETVHCKESVDMSEIGLEVQGFVFHLLQTHDCPFFLSSFLLLSQKICSSD